MSPTTTMRKSPRALGLVLTVILVAGLLLGAALPQRVQAVGGIVFDGSPGMDPPPATLGPYSMIPFPADSRPVPLDVNPRVFEDVTAVPGPTGALLFDRPMSHRRVNLGIFLGWGSVWSHGYRGDVYDSYPGTQVVMTLPANTHAFYFYVQGHVFRTCATFTATAQDGTTSGPVQVCNGNEYDDAARYFGFYSTGAALSTITLSCEMPFAVGEFGIDGSAPGHCTRADVSVKIYGGWDGIPVKAYVGGSEQDTLYTARDGFGEPAVLWTFYPPATGWDVSVAPQLPAGLDPERWQYKLIWGPADGSAVEEPLAAGATIYPCSEQVFYFQLVDTGALPKE